MLLPNWFKWTSNKFIIILGQVSDDPVAKALNFGRNLEKIGALQAPIGWYAALSKGR